MRLLAAFFVLYSHQFALTGRPEPSVLGAHSLGGLGVLIFFSISGYLVSQSWTHDPHVLRFAGRRLLRIWPGFAVSVLFCALVIGPLVSALDVRSYLAHPALWAHLATLKFQLRELLPIRFEGSTLPTIMNGSLWTIPIELKCYLLLALMGVTGLLRHRWLVLALTLALVLEYALLTVRGERVVPLMAWTPEPQFSVEFALFFFAGVLWHRFGHGALRRAPWPWLAASAVLGLASYLAGRPVLTLWLVVPILTLSIAVASTPVLRRAGRFGDLSYGVYLYAFPVQQTMIWLFKDRLPWGMVLLLAMLGTTALAALSWHLVEKHALRWKPRRPTNPAPALSAGSSR